MRLSGACLTATALAVLLAGCGSDSDPSDPIAGTDPGTLPGNGSEPSVPGDDDTTVPPDTDPVPGTDGDPAAPGTDPAPGTDSSPGTGGVSLITSDSYEAILRQVVAVANDEPLDAASAGTGPLFVTLQDLTRQALDTGAASGEGLGFVSRDADDAEGAVAVTFSCADGGTLVVDALVYDDLTGSPFVEEFTTNDGCTIGSDVYMGRVSKNVRIVRGTDVATFEGFSVTRANGDATSLDGDYSDSGPEGVGPVVELGWNDADLLVVDGGETTRIDGYTSARRSDVPYANDDRVPEATAKVMFSANAPWSSGVTLGVTLDLSIVSDEASRTEAGLYPAQWMTGALRVTAPDGSGLTLSPETGDPATFSVAIDGEDDAPIVRDWSDGFQVNCPEPFDCR